MRLKLEDPLSTKNRFHPRPYAFGENREKQKRQGH
jgi:hypothetical protein